MSFGAGPRLPFILSNLFYSTTLTPTFLLYNVPADNQQHLINVALTKSVTVTEVGGGLTFRYVSFGAIATPVFVGTNGAVGVQQGAFTVIVDPGTQCWIAQASALTSGASEFSLYMRDIT